MPCEKRSPLPPPPQWPRRRRRPPALPPLLRRGRCGGSCRPCPHRRPRGAALRRWRKRPHLCDCPPVARPHHAVPGTRTGVAGRQAARPLATPSLWPSRRWRRLCLRRRPLRPPPPQSQKRQRRPKPPPLRRRGGWGNSWRHLVRARPAPRRCRLRRAPSHARRECLRRARAATMAFSSLWGGIRTTQASGRSSAPTTTLKRGRAGRGRSGARRAEAGTRTTRATRSATARRHLGGGRRRGDGRRRRVATPPPSTTSEGPAHVPPGA